MRLVSLLLMCMVLSSCAVRFHVSVETDYKSLCDECKKKPMLSGPVYKDNQSDGIKIIDIPFLAHL
jgi:hypothetical protein